MSAVAQHPNITLMTSSEVEEVSGYIGNFDVKIRQKAKYVNHDLCTGCGLCIEKCPNKKITSEFDEGMGLRTAIYKPFAQAVPGKPVIDPERCRKITKDRCGICAKNCPREAINFDDKDKIVEDRFGAVVVGTGFDLWDWKESYGEYGYGKYPDVITGLQFERLVNASGPTAGKILRPSDGKEPKNVVFIKCVGSRDDAKGKKYCSRACCMYTAKHAHQVIEKIEDGQAIVFYMDVRTPGKAYDEFYQRTVHEGAQYVRGRVSRIYQLGEKLVVCGEDSLLGKPVQVEADMVVLATAMVPSSASSSVGQLFGLSTDPDGWYTEAHPKLKPVETFTGGVYLAGCCQGPKDIPDTVAQASAAAAKVAALFSNDEMATSPLITGVNEAVCSGCGLCVDICPYKAIELKTIEDRHRGDRQVASVNSGLCQGCGACTVACRAGAIDLKGFTNEQVLAEVDALCL